VGILIAAQTAVFLESRELAEAYYEPLLAATPLGRFFWGPASVVPIGPASRILGELALLRGDKARAREHFDIAIAECREMEATPFLALSEEARARVGGQTAPPRPVASGLPEVSLALSREGDTWAVTGSTKPPFRVKHARGMDYLDHLLRSPGREVYVLVLAGAGEGPEDAGAILDDRAKQAYRQRVEELEDELAEGERMGDRGRTSRAREELEALAEQLASAVGLGGRDRKAASNVERARVNVQRRLKDAIRRIAEHDAALGRYLDATVRTGTYCVYRPV
jgi:non-specific serine/threonine protein kinase